MDMASKLIHEAKTPENITCINVPDKIQVLNTKHQVTNITGCICVFTTVPIWFSFTVMLGYVFLGGGERSTKK